MSGLVLDKVSSVAVLLPGPPSRFYVTDRKGIIYYWKNSPPPVLKFNLPAGEYFFNRPVQVQKVSEPIKFRVKAELPKNEHRFDVYRFKTVVKPEQRGFAQVTFPEGIISVNEKFSELPAPVQYWIIEHEKGHKFYKTEEFADLYALKKYLKAGFNPSTILYAFESGLLTDSPENNRRMKTFFLHFNELVQTEK